MCSTESLVTKLIDKLVKPKYPEMRNFTVSVRDGSVFSSKKIVNVNIYFDYYTWLEIHKTGFVNDDYLLIDNLDDTIRNDIETILGYLNTTPCINMCEHEYYNDAGNFLSPTPF